MSDGLPNTLHNALAAIESVDSAKSRAQILSLVDALSHLADSHTAEATLDLLYDAHSPLWHSRDYMTHLGMMALRIPYVRLVAHVLDSAETISGVSVEASEIYPCHLGRLTDMLLTAKQVATNSNDIVALDEGINQLADIRERVKTDVLLEIVGQDIPEEKEVELVEQYKQMASSEFDALPTKTDTSNLMPMHYLKAIPRFDTDTHEKIAGLDSQKC